MTRFRTTIAVLGALAALGLGACLPSIEGARVGLCVGCSSIDVSDSVNATSTSGSATAHDTSAAVEEDAAEEPLAGVSESAGLAGGGEDVSPAAAGLSPDPLAETLREAEGLALEEYAGPVSGDPHIGFGHRIDEATAEMLLDADIEEARAAARRIVGPEAWERMPTEVRRVVTECAFVLGATGLARFRWMVHDLRSGDYESAAAELEDSAWAEQVPSRVARLADALRSAATDTGDHP